MVSKTKTIYILAGDAIEVEVMDDGRAEVLINIDQVETELSLSDIERRMLIRVLGGRL